MIRRFRVKPLSDAVASASVAHAERVNIVCARSQLRQGNPALTKVERITVQRALRRLGFGEGRHYTVISLEDANEQLMLPGF